MKCSSVKLTELLVNRCLMLLEPCFLPTYGLWHSESSSAVTLLLHADWMMLKNVSNQCGVNSAIVVPSAADIMLVAAILADSC